MKVYPDDFGAVRVVATNRMGEAEMTSWVGVTPSGLAGSAEEEEAELPAWCNKVNSFLYSGFWREVSSCFGSTEKNSSSFPKNSCIIDMYNLKVISS